MRPEWFDRRLTVKAVCPVCERLIAVLVDGRIGKHGNVAAGADRRSVPCRGWGQMPKDAGERE